MKRWNEMSYDEKARVVVISGVTALTVVCGFKLGAKLASLDTPHRKFKLRLVPEDIPQKLPEQMSIHQLDWSPSSTVPREVRESIKKIDADIFTNIAPQIEEMVLEGSGDDVIENTYKFLRDDKEIAKHVKVLITDITDKEVNK